MNILMLYPRSPVETFWNGSRSDYVAQALVDGTPEQARVLSQLCKRPRVQQERYGAGDGMGHQLGAADEDDRQEALDLLVPTTTLLQAPDDTARTQVGP